MYPSEFGSGKMYHIVVCRNDKPSKNAIENSNKVGVESGWCSDATTTAFGPWTAERLAVSLTPLPDIPAGTEIIQSRNIYVPRG